MDRWKESRERVENRACNVAQTIPGSVEQAWSERESCETTERQTGRGQRCKVRIPRAVYETGGRACARAMGAILPRAGLAHDRTLKQDCLQGLGSPCARSWTGLGLCWSSRGRLGTMANGWRAILFKIAVCWCCNSWALIRWAPAFRDVRVLCGATTTLFVARHLHYFFV
jgi:hypothetical protein